MLGKDRCGCLADPSDVEWEEGDGDLDEDEDEDDDFEEEDMGATIDMADEAAEEDSGPELSTDYLDNPAYTVDPPGLRRKAQAAEVCCPDRVSTHVLSCAPRSSLTSSAREFCW